MEFVERLLALFPPGGGPPELLVGEVSAPFRTTYEIPGEARVIGSVDYGSRIQMAALQLPTGPWTEASWWEAQLEDVGFEQVQPPRRRGFDDAPPPSSQYCRDTVAMQVGVAPAGDSVAIQLTRASATGVCSQLERMSRYDSDSPIPYLDSPPGMRRRGGGSGGGADEWDAHTRLSGPLGATPVRDHFEAQMVEQGGVPIASVSNDDIAVSTVRMPDPGGEGSWFSLLTVTTDADGDLSVFLRMTREGP